jgi:cytochrome c oxidase cbb3-type subunit 3
MPSLFPARPAVRAAAAVVLVAGLALAGCNRQRSDSAEQGPSGSDQTAVTTLFPGGGAAPPEDPRGRIYDGDAAHIANGKRLFGWYNCSGCHFNGGGGIGPR